MKKDHKPLTPFQQVFQWLQNGQLSLNDLFKTYRTFIGFRTDISTLDKAYLTRMSYKVFELLEDIEQKVKD